MTSNFIKTAYKLSALRKLFVFTLFILPLILNAENSEQEKSKTTNKKNNVPVRHLQSYGFSEKKFHRPERSKDWMLFGIFWDSRKASLTLKNQNTQKLTAAYHSGSLEWAAMADNEDMFSEFHFLPEFTGLISGYIDRYEDYPAASNKNSRLGLFSFMDFFTSYQLLRGYWGGLSPGFWLGHKAVYFDTGQNSVSREKLFFSNFLLGLITEYSYSPFQLFHFRISYVFAPFSPYARNNRDAIYQQGKIEIYFPLDVKYGWSKMQNQDFLIKASLRYSHLNTEEKRFSIFFHEWKEELGFCWLY